jgi:hypothetical protein
MTMIQVVLNNDQAKAVQQAGGTVELRDLQGMLLGYVSPPPTEAEIAEAKRRLESDGPWYNTEQVMDHLRSTEQG